MSSVSPTEALSTLRMAPGCPSATPTTSRLNSSLRLAESRDPEALQQVTEVTTGLARAQLGLEGLAGGDRRESPVGKPRRDGPECSCPESHERLMIFGHDHAKLAGLPNHAP